MLFAGKSFYFVKKRNTFVMAIMITDECINCGACEPECPNNAIYESGAQWAFTDGTTVTGEVNSGRPAG